ncbi:hypothetical protein EJ05DRAFT_442938 [Pseudovirgaria hyperparasitica]|uniref:Ceramide glucosyltransferase n=1 Tax=Pseudovirgaria hyperparasitica TaxID=470096 RepID=A0A6A6VW88_9PEZI|nr:uncharacterized protein EJ05DRAFT_442938 [Pseudovirgaria hyperparasitica]KAF2754852.1 hypothetical protein EJ05DRAFT_442938 [Pseudovirgaria hyperparasitica]
MLQQTAATAALIWYCAVLLVCGIGYTQLRRFYSKTRQPASCIKNVSAADLPHITIIRPVVGIEPKLHQCLASTFQQIYPRNKLTLYFCISSRNDPALAVLERLLEDFPHFDAKILVESEDPALQGDGRKKLGPNPKIRNMSRAYREAKSDLIWIVDCNVWIGKGVAGRMVDTLCGYSGQRPNKFVHQLPLSVDMPLSAIVEETHISDSARDSFISSRLLGDPASLNKKPGFFDLWGGRLDEMFMSTSHPKFYTAINTVLIAPCIVGKSSMFRRSHLDYLTKQQNSSVHGIDFFSYNICEDHLIGDLLWKNSVPEELSGQGFGKHALVFGDLAIQPMAGTSVADYIARRARWLRVRKFTVMLATLVEHGTESFAASAYGAYSITTLSYFEERLHIPPTWTSFGIFWLCSVALWCFVDWTQYVLLHSAASIEVDEKTPTFVRPPLPGHKTRRPFGEWITAWIGRELLAFPIWAWAVFGGVTVVWREKKFWVGMDMKVHEIVDRDSKARID